MQPIRCQPPSAWAKACSAFPESTRKLSLEMKMVPDVPSEMLQPPRPTTPVPTAAAALSPAPAATFTPDGMPSRSAASGRSVPTVS